MHPAFFFRASCCSLRNESLFRVCKTNLGRYIYVKNIQSMDRAVGNVATAKLRKIFRVKLSTRVVQICVGGDGKLLLVLTYRACELWSLDSARLLARYSLLQGEEEEEGRKGGYMADAVASAHCGSKWTK